MVKKPCMFKHLSLRAASKKHKSRNVQSSLQLFMRHHTRLLSSPCNPPVTSAPLQCSASACHRATLWNHWLAHYSCLLSQFVKFCPSPQCKHLGIKFCQCKLQTPLINPDQRSMRIFKITEWGQFLMPCKILKKSRIRETLNLSTGADRSPDTVQCSAVQCSAVKCSALKCCAVQCHTVPYSAVQFCAAQCSVVQCSTLKCCAFHCRKLGS